MKKLVVTFVLIVASVVVGISSEAKQSEVIPGVKIPVNENISIAGQSARFVPAAGVGDSEVFISEKLLDELSNHAIDLDLVRQEKFFGYNIPVNKHVVIEGKPVFFESGVENDSPDFFASRAFLNLNK